MSNRGEIVIVDFRTAVPAAGVRPALIVQNDGDNRRMANTIVAQVTTTIHRSLEPTQLLIDASHPDWSASGLLRPSVVNCSSIYTIRQSDIARVVGSLSDSTMKAIEACLKSALAIS